MSLCTVCGGYECDHTSEERGQTIEEMTRPLTTEERNFFLEEKRGSLEIIALAKRNAHL